MAKLDEKLHLVQDDKMAPPIHLEDRAHPGSETRGGSTGIDEDGGVVVSEMTPNELQEAYTAATREHRMSFREGLRLYKSALFWTAVMSGVSPHSFHLIMVAVAIPTARRLYPLIVCVALHRR